MRYPIRASRAGSRRTDHEKSMMLAEFHVAYLQIIEAISVLPNWIVSMAFAAAGILAALLVYALIVRIVCRTLGARHPYLRSLLTRTNKGTFLMALMVAA